MEDKKSIIRAAIFTSLILAISVASYFLIKAGRLLPQSQNQSANVSQNQNQSTAEAPVPTVEEQLAGQTKINQFSSAEELSEFLSENSAGRDAYASYGTGRMTKSLAMDQAVELSAPTAMTNEVWEESAMAADEVAPGAEVSADFSTTNIQVKGVDEADIIKNDGEYMYAVVDQSLYIIKAYPPEKAEILSKIEFKSRPEEIYINGDKLIVFGADDKVQTLAVYKSFRRYSPYSFFKVFDTADKKNPKQVLDLDFEGNYFNSRMIGDYVYFFTSNYQYYIDGETPMPRVLQDGQPLWSEVRSDKCPNCPAVYYFDIPYPSYNFVTVSAINVKDASQKPMSESYLLPGAQNVYMSEKNLYLAYTKYVSEHDIYMEAAEEILSPRLSAKQAETIAKIKATDKAVLSEDEKTNKINAILERYLSSLSDEDMAKVGQEIKDKVQAKYTDLSKELEKTVIHKIAVNQGDLKYQTFGEVTGSVLNQFSMDENNGYFRIATTKSQDWLYLLEDSAGKREENKSYNNLYVLDENLKTAGTLEKLAEGERIYSVRFMQNRAYMVTFKQTDPLFVIDLADPKNPRVLGELKIPGYSDYLHPYDDTTLIGLGKETSEDSGGRVKTHGLKLSLFDVSDVANPKEISKYELGEAGSNSIALHDHKAFLFSKEKNLLSIPVSIMEGSDSSFSRLAFSGAAVFSVDKTGFTLKGKIDHSDGGIVGSREYWWGSDYYDNTVKRILYIGDYLYTFSSKYLGINELSDLKQSGRVELKKEKQSDFEVIN